MTTSKKSQQSRRNRSVRIQVAGGALLVAATLTSGSAVAPPSVAAAPDVEAPASGVAAVPELSTATSNTVRHSDGTFTTTAYSSPVNYQDGDGDWVPIDNSLVAAPGTAYDVQNAGNSFTAKIPEDPSSTPVRFSEDGQWVTMQMDGLGDEPADIDHDTATFDQVAKADEVAYRVTNTALKESITLDAAPTASLSYTYTIDASVGLTPTLQADGSISVGQAGADPSFEIPAGMMYDSSADAASSRNVTYALHAIDGQWKLTVTPDLDWLTDSTRVYPVTIDPSLTNQADLRDCNLRSGSPDSIGCGDNNYYIKVGRLDSSHKNRGVISFNTTSIPTTATVTASAVHLYLDSTVTLDTSQLADYAMYQAGKKFDGNASWNSSGANGAWTGGSPGSTAYATKSLNGSSSGDRTFPGIEDVVQAWVTNPSNNTGLVIKQVGETTDNIIGFYSDNSATPTSRIPFINVSYVLPTGDELADSEGAAGDLAAVTLSASTVSQTSTTTAQVPGCTSTDPSDCTMSLSVTEEPTVVLTGADLDAVLAESASLGALPRTVDETKPGQYCLPTGCYSKVYSQPWVQHLCFVTCGSNQATQSGRFYYTPDGKYVWETVSHGGVVGSHSCRVDHMIGVTLSPGKDNWCTAPRYANNSIHSHLWLTVDYGWFGSELFLGSVWHSGDGTSSYQVKSY